jgi:hypothetical protein
VKALNAYRNFYRKIEALELSAGFCVEESEA